MQNVQWFVIARSCEKDENDAVISDAVFELLITNNKSRPFLTGMKGMKGIG